MRLSALHFVFPAFSLLCVPFRSAGEAALKTSFIRSGRRLPVCRCDSLSHLGLRCGFKATAWAPFYPHSTRDDTIRRESHRAVIDAMYVDVTFFSDRHLKTAKLLSPLATAPPFRNGYGTRGKECLAAELVNRFPGIQPSFLLRVLRC